MLGKPAAFNVTVTSLLNPCAFTEACVAAGSAALAAEQHKHNVNNATCSELGWKCVPLAVESYGCWGAEELGSTLHIWLLAWPNSLASRPPQVCMGDPGES